MTEEKKGKTRQKASRALKHARVRTLAMSGKTNNEIAKEMGISRQQVTKILTSEETKQIIKEAESEVVDMVKEAIATMRYAMQMRFEMQALPTSLRAAERVLKSVGALKEKVELEHSFPRPTIIERPSGVQVILGAEREDGEEE